MGAKKLRKFPMPDVDPDRPCTQCHFMSCDRGDGRCERHGRMIPACNVERLKPRSLRRPIESFTSDGGRTFIVGDAERLERSPRDSLWSDHFPVYDQQGKRVGTLLRDWSYGVTAEGDPTWHGSITELRWRTNYKLTQGLGYDVAKFDSIEECARAWSRSADQILDFLEKKA